MISNKSLVLIVTGVVIAVTAVVMAQQSLAPASPGDQPVTSASVVPMPTASATPGQPITREGKLVCLPHRDTSGPQTDECAIGLRANDGVHFGLSDPDQKFSQVLQQSTGTLLNVSGTLQKDDDAFYNKYDIQGTIRLTSANIH